MGSATGLMSGIIAVIVDGSPGLTQARVTLYLCVAGFLVGLVYITPGGQHILTLVTLYTARK